MEKEFNLAGTQYLVEKTGKKPTYNGVACIEIQIREQQLTWDDRPNGYFLFYRLVPRKYTWAQIEHYLIDTVINRYGH